MIDGIYIKSQSLASYRNEVSPLPAVLCTGGDLYLLKLRCEVLAQAGYQANAATVTESLKLLGSEDFDLVIISAEISDVDRERLLPAIGNRTRVLVLKGFISPVDLLIELEKLLKTQPRGCL